MQESSYNLLLSQDSDGLERFVRAYQSRGLVPVTAPTWCFFHACQIAASEIRAWLKVNPLTGLWLTFDHSQVWGTDLLRAQLVPMTSTAELLHLFAGVWGALTAHAPPPPKVRQALPWLLQPYGWPDILGELPAPAEPVCAAESPWVTIQRLTAHCQLTPWVEPMVLSRQTAFSQLFILAWMASELASPLLIITPPAGHAPPTWPPYASSVLEVRQNQWFLHFELDGRPLGTLRALADAWVVLEPAVPNGSEWMLKIAPLAWEPTATTLPDKANVHCYQGHFLATQLQLVSGYPAMAEARMQSALQLADWVESGGPWQFPASARDIITALAKQESLRMPRDYQMTEHDLTVPEFYHRAFFARGWFRHDFGDCWDFGPPSSAQAGLEAGVEALMQLGCHLTSGLAKPHTNQRLLDGKSGSFWQADVAKMPPLQQERLDEYISYFVAQGFRPLVTLVWEPGEDVLLQVLVAPEQQAYGAVLLPFWGLEVECVSYFNNGAILTTTTVAERQNYEPEQLYRYSCPTASVPQLVNKHQAHLQQFKTQHQVELLPHPEDVTLCLARIDNALTRQLREQHMIAEGDP